jgi:3-(3-hydroxy-phenyl)propionate hydroxylase
VLALAKTQPFARTLVNSGRLSTPTTLHGSPLNTPDTQPFSGPMVPGAAAADARVTRADGRDDWLLRQLGDGFAALVGHDPALERALRGVEVDGFALRVLAVAPAGVRTGAALVDRDGDVARRYDLRPGSVVLLRPDAHVCARWRDPGRDQVAAAMRRALAATREPTPCP